jgi:hypothetical protein
MKDYHAVQGIDDITCARLIRQAGPIPIASHRAEDRDSALAVGAGRADGLRGARAVVRAAAGRVVSSAHEQWVEGAAGAVVLYVAALQVCGAHKQRVLAGALQECHQLRWAQFNTTYHQRTYAKRERVAHSNLY